MAQAEIKAVITAEDKASPALAKFGSGLGNLAHTAAVAGAALAATAYAAATAFAVLGTKTAAQMETARQGFITLLGSAQKADETIARIKQEAMRTPFEVAGLTQATQMLASVTKDGNKAINIILDVGEALAAMGRGQAELDRISVNLQQIAAVGKASMIDIKQFAFAGIPIFEMLQEETGLAGEALENFIADGKVSFDMLVKMFDNANNEGGRFFNAFKNQAGTFDQLWSNLKDTFAQTAAEIVVSTGLFDLLKQGMENISKWVTENKETISNVFRAMFAGLGWVWNNILMPVFNYFKEKWPAIVAFLTEAWNKYLGPMWNEFVRVLKEELWPALQTLWQSLQPYLPMIGVYLVAAVGAFIIGLITLSKILNFIVFIVQNVINEVNKMIAGFRIAGAFIWGFWQGMVQGAQEVVWAIQRIQNAIDKVLGGKNQIAVGIGKMAQGRAVGGPVNSGQPYIVGEKGPELFVPSSGGSIVPNNKTGGGNTTININVGLMTGSAIERREAAMKMFEDLKVIASQQGQTVGQMLGA